MTAPLIERAAAAGITMRKTAPAKGSKVKHDAGLPWEHRSFERPRSYKSGASPATYVVLVNGRRVDSFLSEARATRKIRELLETAV